MANVLQKSNTILFRILKLISENAKLQLANNVPECLMCGCIPRRRVGKNRGVFFCFSFLFFVCKCVQKITSTQVLSTGYCSCGVQCCCVSRCVS